ncbi:hypothetical protein F7725_007134 [Dissostichus mawsoni]|uniref:polynucleotide adenylyltransferase n=1 Tax=Dissostichus mawsoni TaxID=36200 RepID=A0A7J5XWX5_DISMA|nr:hypothetical protein F7725_007134 [Dissostichus mawsoni]
MMDLEDGDECGLKVVGLRMLGVVDLDGMLSALQFPAPALSSLHHAEQNISVHSALVSFVQDHHSVAQQQGVSDGLAQQHALAELRPLLLGHPSCQRYGCHSTGLSDGDEALSPDAGLVQILRDLSGLPRASLPYEEGGQLHPDLNKRCMGPPTTHEEECAQENDLIEILKSFGCFESDNLPGIVPQKVGGKLVPFGSHHLGVASKGADIDVLCVGPGFLQRKDFFSSFVRKLKRQRKVKDIRVIEEAFVPVVKLTFEGIEVIWLKKKCCLCSLQYSSIKDRLSLCQGGQEQSPTGNGPAPRGLVTGDRPPLCEESERLQSNRGDPQAQRNIYSNSLGFLGGVSWAILVARICQEYPNASASTLVTKFFKEYNMWKWPNPIMLRELKDCHFNLPVWDARVNLADRSHSMPIITPAYPMQNTAFNVTPSTLAIMKEEIQRGHTIAGWSQLFEKPNFLRKYKVGLVESRIRHLVVNLERNVLVTRAHINVSPTLNAAWATPDVTFEKRQRTFATSEAGVTRSGSGEWSV